MTLTFGECAENHVGNQQLGSIAASGFSVSELRMAGEKFAARGCTTELVDLSAACPDAPEAAVLVVRGGLAAFGVAPEAMYEEHDALDVDTKALMYKRVVNKKARHNLCYDDAAQEAEYAAGKGTVVAFAAVPLLDAVRRGLPELVGAKAAGLKCELNKYYDPSITGIGFHGDSERKMVVAIRLGVAIPLHYQWFLRHEPVGERVNLSLRHGDMYVMSEKATGHDWKCSSFLTLRHAAGCERFTTIKPKRGRPAAVVEGPRRVKRPAPESSEQDAVCKAAEELRASPPPARALELLRSLDAAAVDVGTLHASGVAKAVKALRGQDGEIGALSATLFARWKGIAKAAGVVSAEKRGK